MKKLFLLLFLITSFIATAQTIPAYKTIKLTGPELGTKNDSVVVRNGASGGVLKILPVSQIKSITNLDRLADDKGITIFSSNGNDTVLPLVTTVNAGLQAPDDKSKLNGIAPGATANQTDAYLLNRVNHTGVQPATTITEDVTHRFATDAEKAIWNAKQEALVSGTNIKTVETQSILGSGNIDLSKADVGLLNVDNTSDANKPVSTAQQDALDLKINSTEKGAINGVATLGADGKVPNNQIPALAISETFPVNSQAAMLALTAAEQGDVAVRTDISKSFILTQSPASTLGNWQELLTPTDAVQSVNGQTGNVNLTTANISDSSNKRYQTDVQQTNNDATSSIQTQLNSKEPIISPKNTAFNKNFGTTAGTVVEGGTLGSNAYNSTAYLPLSGGIMSNPIDRSVSGIGSIATPYYDKIFTYANTAASISFGNSGQLDNGTYIKLAVNDRVTSNTPIESLVLSPEVATFSSTVTAPTFIGALNGNASTATTLQTARTIGTTTGDVTSAGSPFNGSANNTNALTLATVNSNVGTFGNASNVAQSTVNAKGLTTAISNVPIQISESQVTGLVSDLTSKQSIGATHFVGTTSIANNRASGAQTLTGVSIDGTANNSNKWNTAILEEVFSTVNPGWLLGYDAGTYKAINPPILRSFLGLGSAAYLNDDVLATDNTIVRRTNDGLAMIKGGYFEMNKVAVDAVGMSDFVTTGGNGVLRRNSIGAVKTFLGLGSNAYTSTPYQPADNTLFKSLGGLTSNSNANTIAGNGYYLNVTGNGTGNSNFPLGYGTVSVIGNNTDHYSQIQTAYNTNGEHYVRGRWAGNYGGWRKVWDDGNFNPANYLPLSGGTLSGQLIAPSAVLAGIQLLSGDFSEIIDAIKHLALNYNTNKNIYLVAGSSSGRVGIGTINPSEKLDVVGNSKVSGTSTASGFFNSSDRRLKTILKRDGDVAYFKWKDGRDTKKHIGYIAQEVRRTNPDQVQKGEDGYLSVSYIEILVAKNRDLEKKLEALEDRINQLEKSK